MSTFTWKSPASGSWGDSASWLDGVVPNDALADVAVSQAGSYEVAVPAGQSYLVNSIAMAAATTLRLSGGLAVAANSTLGATTIEAGGSLSGVGSVNLSGTTLLNQGRLTATSSSNFLRLSNGTLTNEGTLAAGGSGMQLFLDRVALTNLAGGTLTGGSYEATGEPTGGGSLGFLRISLPVGSAVVDTLAAQVRLTYPSSTLLFRDAPLGAAVPLEASLGTIAPAGRLELRGGRGWTTTKALSVAGVLQVEGGTLSAAGGMSVAAGGTVEGFGTLSAPASVDGLLRASGGLLVAGPLGGGGTLEIAEGAELRLAAGSYGHTVTGSGLLRAQSGTVSLTGAVGPEVALRGGGGVLDIAGAFAGTAAFAGTGSIRLSNPAGFSGVLLGFGSDVALDLAGVAASAASAAGQALLVTTGSGTLSFDLGSDYAGRSFAVAPDGSGGSRITVSGVDYGLGGGSWSRGTLTWSFAGTNHAGAQASFSGFLDPAAQEAAAVRAALARWAQASGLSFVEVADTPTAEGTPDLRFGWADFGAAPGIELGRISGSVGTLDQYFRPGMLVRLQDPAVTPLQEVGGALTYQGTEATLAQVALHAIGRALGLAALGPSDDPASVMQPLSTAANRDLSLGDIVGIQALYAGIANQTAPEPPVLSIAGADALLDEGNGGSTGFTFTVTRTGDLSGSASATYTVAGQGANPADAADFAGGALPGGVVSFGAGQKSATVTVAVAGDGTVEADEGFAVTLAAPTGATLGTAVAAGTILNDDATAIAIAPAAVALAEGGAGATTQFSFTVTRSDTGLGAISLGYAVAPGALRPANAADFVGGALPAGTVSFAADATEASIVIEVAGDAAQEANEAFTVTLGGAPAGATLAVASAGGTILADEPILDITPVLGNGGKVVPATPGYFTGPVAGVEKELVLLSSENLTMAVAGPNWFLHSGSGDDAIAAASGTNVLDGGSGSNFLTGGSGADTFFLDARGAVAPIWSTVRGFDPGDGATLWGVAASSHTLAWADGEGAPGFQGLTLHADAPGQPAVLLTLPGYSTADLAPGGRLAVFTENLDPASGSTYTFIFAL